MCEYNHLTNFAILLSPDPPSFEKKHGLVFKIIGYVGMALTVGSMGLTHHIHSCSTYVRPLKCPHKTKEKSIRVNYYKYRIAMNKLNP